MTSRVLRLLQELTARFGRVTVDAREALQARSLAHDLTIQLKEHVVNEAAKPRLHQ